MRSASQLALAIATAILTVSNCAKPLRAQAPPAPAVAAVPDVNLFPQNDRLQRGLRVEPKADGLRVIQNTASTCGWVELHRDVDTRRYPVLRVAVAGAGPGALWCVKVQFPPAKEESLITETDQNGVFNFPIGEYLETYTRGEGVFGFFLVGKQGTVVTLKSMDLRARRVAPDICAADENPHGGLARRSLPRRL